MIITCPDCTARFVLPERALGEAGKKVRCGKCRHTWFMQPPARSAEDTDSLRKARLKAARDAAATAEAVASGAKTYLPAIAAKNRIAHEWIVFAFCFVWLIVATFYLFGPNIVNKYEFPKPFYKKLGIIPTKGMRLYDTEMEKIKQYGRASVSISGVIANESGETRLVPDLMISQVNHDGVIVETELLKSGFPPIEAGGELNYHNIVPLASAEIAYVSVDLGDRIELRRRTRQ